jgi:hypothetical protein
MVTRVTPISWAKSSTRCGQGNEPPPTHHALSSLTNETTCPRQAYTVDAKLLRATIDARQEHFQNLTIAKIGKDHRNVEILHGDHANGLWKTPLLGFSDLMAQQQSVPK